MNISDFLRLPPAVRLGVVVMLWPAIWATALLIVALAGDMVRETEMLRKTSPARRRT